MMTNTWKGRLYDAYVSSGQAAPRTIRPDITADAMLRPQTPHLTHFIRRHIPRDREARIIDLGCGDGIFLHFLQRAGYTHATGCDVSPEQVARAQQLGLTGVRQSTIDAFLASTGDESADVVLLMDVLEHLTRDELFHTLDGVFRVLRPGGLCLVHLPNAEGIFGMRIRYGDFTHEQAFTAKSARQVLRTIGFKDVRCHEDRPVVHGVTSLIRRVVWDVGSIPHRVLLAAETGEWGFVLSQNFLVKAIK
jgi:SAM-dependent methyltransferase